MNMACLAPLLTIGPLLRTKAGVFAWCHAARLVGLELTARQIAPFLWSRGIRRIDEVFLSHADLVRILGKFLLTPR